MVMPRGAAPLGDRRDELKPDGVEAPRDVAPTSLESLVVLGRDAEQLAR